MESLMSPKLISSSEVNRQWVGRIGLAVVTAVMLLGCASKTTTVMPEQSLAKPETNNGCPQQTRIDIEARILAQIEALGRESFDEALDHASLAFRKSIDTSSFEAMIRTGFPILLDNGTVSFGRCQEFGDRAMIEVSFREQPSASLIYSLGLADSQWWIEAAAPLSDIFPNQEELKAL